MGPMDDILTWYCQYQCQQQTNLAGFPIFLAGCPKLFLALRLAGELFIVGDPRDGVTVGNTCGGQSPSGFTSNEGLIGDLTRENEGLMGFYGTY